MNVPINFDEPTFPDLNPTNSQTGELTGAGMIEHGTVGGQPVVALRVKPQHGPEVVVQVTWGMWQTMTGAFRGRRAFVEGQGRGQA